MAAITEQSLRRRCALTTNTSDPFIGENQSYSDEVMENQYSLAGRRNWKSYVVSNPHKRLRLPGSRHPTAQTYAGTDPAEKRWLIPARFLRFIGREDLGQLDPDTIPVLTKREQRKAEKREKKKLEKEEKRRLQELDELERAEKRKLEELVEYQKREMYDRISRQLEVNERERQLQQPEVVKKSLKDKVKTRLKKRSSQKPKDYAIPSSQAILPSPDFPQRPPHIDDFQSKGELRRWYRPADVEALPPPTTIEELPPAELPAIPATIHFTDFNNDVVKKDFDDTFDTDILPPPLPRSPSPCLSSNIPRRGVTLSETPTVPNSKQMQCDYCHGAIKMTGYHYACVVCDDGDRLYCVNCTNDGRTCRHTLIEKTRNIKRHPTNPQHGERRNLLVVKDLEMSSDTSTHVELSACEPEHIPTSVRTPVLRPLNDYQPSSSGTRRPREDSAPHPSLPEISPISTDLYREFETKRREQEIVFREKEVTLREREAMLREREAWTISRERDAAMVQQMQAAAMLQQRERATEVGAQFSPVSPVSRKPSCCWPSPSISRQSSSRSNPGESITLHSSSKGKKPKFELVDAVAVLEASVAGIDIAETNVRTHGNSTKRKASAANGKSQNGGSANRKNQPQNKPQERQNSNTSNRDETEDEEDEEEGGSPKRQKQDQGSDQTGGKIFACPYNKYDSRRYAEGNTAETHYRHCAGGLFRDISRIKQHLKRVHHRPKYHCQRCFEVFKTSNECEKHYSDVKGCSARDCPWPEMLDKVQQEQIHTKRPRKDPQEQWFEIFAIIFPGVTPPESAYIEASEVKNENREILEQFVQLFNNRLNSALDAPGQTWLQSKSARDFLKSTLQQTMVEMMQTVSIGSESSVGEMPSVLVSPVSPHRSDFTSQSRTNSQSSRESSVSRHQRRLSTVPRTPVVRSSSDRGPPLRPALKVTTRDINASRGYNSAGASETCTASRQGPYTFANVRIPSHVAEDQGYDKSSDSWMSGDDKDAMSTIFQTNEPTSATSTSSRKSVTWASPPSRSTSRSSYLKEAETLSRPDYHKSPNTPYMNSMSVWANQGSSVEEEHEAGRSLKHKSSGRADSAYGTMSHHTSQSSLFQDHEMNTDLYQMAYIDPQMLLMDPARQSWEAQHSQPNGSGMSDNYLNYGMSNAGMNF